MSAPVLTPGQERAILGWAELCGRTWKSQLLRSWGSHNYHGAEGEAELAWLRNAYGPRWLASYRLPKAPQAPSYVPMIKGVGEDKWLGNGLRFATAEEALAYATDLQYRWMGCKSGADNRMAGESTDPVSHVWRDGLAVPL